MTERKGGSRLFTVPLAGRLLSLVILLLLALVVPASNTAADRNAAEIEFWQSVKDTKEAAELEAYLKAYPNGRFSDLARLRLNKLKQGPPAPARTAKSKDGQSSPAEADPDAELYRQLDLFRDVLERVRSNYVEKPDDAMLIDSAINGMLSALDPHSAYLNPQSFRDWQVGYRGQFGGLGIEVTMENGMVKVVAPYDDMPAAKAGVQTNDLITHLDGEQILGLALKHAVDKMRGPINTPITLTIVRKGRDEPFDVKIVRQVIRSHPIKARAENDVAYIKITTFNEEVHADLLKAVEQLKKQIGPKLRGYILDLRNNPGGYGPAIAVADAFLENGTIVVMQGRDGATRRYDAQRGDVTDAKNIVVLINGGTAQASEIVAGALQDHKRATIVGTRSFGQGTIQTIIPLGPNGALRLTTERSYTSLGRSIQAKGVDPDIVVEQSPGSSGSVPSDPTMDTQLQYALQMLRSEVSRK